MDEDKITQFETFETVGWKKAAKKYNRFKTLTNLSIPQIIKRIKPNSFVLDVACGQGDLSVALVNLGCKVTAIDYSSQMIFQAKKVNPKIGITFSQMNAEKIGFKDSYFDFIVSNHGLIHFARPHIVLKEMNRVAKKDGKIILTLWDSPERRIAFSLVNQAYSLHAIKDFAAPTGLGMEYFTNTKNLKRLLRESNWDNIEFKHLDIKWHLDDAESIIDILREGTVLMGGKLNSQPENVIYKIKQEVKKLFEPYTNKDNSVDIPQGVLLVGANKRT